MIEFILVGYTVVGIIIALGSMLKMRYDKEFDARIAKATEGKVVFSWIDKITVPLAVGATWPYLVYRSIKG